MSELRCARCGHQACRQDAEVADYPRFCPMIDSVFEEALGEARPTYQELETRTIAAAAARTEAAGYCRDTRVEEILSFAERLGAKHVGVAFCVGLVTEARLFQDILERHGFLVSSVCCKVGAMPKEELGLGDHEEIRQGQPENSCNPVGQAKLLEAAGTELNIMIGLCVGHDTLFMRNSHAPVTVLVVKDRVLGHNPVAALYLSRSYYRRLREG
ncbi:MAG: DUF1847 domain-containing protein [Deltaproteobacteria bacterium]|nr:DUF1847 domain-containing protein [Deltaproteobacteria bacterium]